MRSDLPIRTAYADCRPDGLTMPAKAKPAGLPPFPQECGHYILSPDGTEWLINEPAIEATATETDANAQITSDL